MKDIIFIMFIIGILIVISAAYPINTSFTEEDQIKEVILEFVEICASNPTEFNLIRSYLSQDYLLLGGEPSSTVFHVIDHYWVSELSINGDSAFVNIKF